jgi:lipopolysaccharide/colanic/teichoic acid biosynthesis glycosyltransferase
LVIINGTGVESEVIEGMLKDSRYGYRILKEISYSSECVAELEELYASARIDEIIQANPTLPVEANIQIVEFAKNKGLQFSFVPNLFDVQRNVVEMQDWNGVPVVSIKNTPLQGWGKVAKRILDIVGSLGAILILSPVFLFIYIAIKLDSTGPAIYSYPRGGMDKDFIFYKFRSMYTHLSNGLGGEEATKVREELWKKNNRGGADSPFLKVKNDPRITRVGKFIRKTKLDEIPQFWNVLKGDMSLVGPRAHMVDEVERYRNRYRRMFSIKPGIFGMSQNAQILNPELPFDEEIRINIYYIENWSLWLDVKILAKSFYLIFFVNKSKENY